MRKVYLHIFKPFADFMVAFFLLLVLSPIFIVVYVIIFIKNNGEVFFYQKRPGKNEKIFKVIKFKTMIEAVDEKGNLLSDEERLTKWGAFFRKTSLDELPQLINVLKGDMSIVGPRPLLPEYLSLYDETQKQRHDIKPGITGWAQVNGRNAISWKEKFNYDVYYVNNVDFLLDIKILFKTFVKVIASKDINQPDFATTSRFKGNEDNE